MTLPLLPEEDVDLMSKVNIKAYRFSISWSRILDGSGRINEVALVRLGQFLLALLSIAEEGIQFYSDLIDSLLAAGAYLVRPQIRMRE